MKNKKISGFRLSYFIFLGVLLAAAAAAVIYVGVSVSDYIKSQPDHQVEKAIEELKTTALDGTLWEKDGVSDIKAGKFEANTDIKKYLTDIFTNKKLGYGKPVQINEDECVYEITSDGNIVAEVRLRKKGEAKQRLLILSIQEYEIVSVLPKSHSYILKFPQNVKIGEDVFVKINNIALEESDGKPDGKNNIEYRIENLFAKPDIMIKDSSDNEAVLRFPEKADGIINFDHTFYTLTLPSSLNVSIDGEKITGQEMSDGRYEYKIRLLKKAEVTVSDLYGNSIEYKGESSLPVTKLRVMTNGLHRITVDGREVPPDIAEKLDNRGFENFEKYVPSLRYHYLYNIVALKDNALIEIYDEKNEKVAKEPENGFIDLTDAALEPTEMPKEIKDEADVLFMAEQWSLFMTNDLEFKELEKYLVKGSSQHAKAYKYNNSIDKTFTSLHDLLDPPFTEESVKNFLRYTDDCFSVDIHFVKHMYLVSHQRVDDEMNDRFYFVKYDDTDDGINNPVWKLLEMKEIVDK